MRKVIRTTRPAVVVCGAAALVLVGLALVGTVPAAVALVCVAGVALV